MPGSLDDFIMLVMTTKRQRSKPDWGSIKKYVVGQMIAQRGWVEKKLTAEGEVRTKQFGLLDKRLDTMSKEIVEASALVSELATHLDERFEEIDRSVQ
jgi:hypothetical protein